MKTYKTVFLLLISITSIAQDRVTGYYNDHFGSSIKLNGNGTFKYTWRFDLQMSWTNGTWISSNDTLYFYMTPVLDTLTLLTPEGIAVDTLILSEDAVSNRIPSDHSLPIRRYPSQNSQLFPDKLFYRDEKLYGIKNGRLITKKIKGFWTNEKYDPWFIKSVER